MNTISTLISILWARVVAPSHLPWPELLLLGVAMVWGTSYGLTKEALVFISVLAFLALRFLLAFVLLLPLLWRDYRRGLVKDAWVALPLGLLLLSIFLAEVYGVAHTTAANAAFLISVCVLLTPFLEWLVERRYPGHYLLVLAFACLLGVYLLTRTAQGGWWFQLNVGDSLLLLAALVRAVMGITTRKLLHGRALSSLSLTALQSAVVGAGALLCLGLSSPQPFKFALPDSAYFWTIMLYLVALCTLFAFFAMNYALRRTSATRVAILTGSEPLFGALFAVLWLGEPLQWYQWLGGGLIVVASMYAALPHTPKVGSVQSPS